jgi:type II secretory pathway pseudopilin PulG
MTLLETLVAMSILSFAGVTMLTLARETSQSVRRALEDEDEVRRASALLDATTLWSREDLDRHLGTRQQGQWRMHVDRDDRSIYFISLRDSTDRHELLQTTLYRPEYPSLNQHLSRGQ